MEKRTTSAAEERSTVTVGERGIIDAAATVSAGGAERAVKREVASREGAGLDIKDVLLIGILLAAGAVLKFFVGTVVNFGMKPNFIIAMYCLIILLIKPRMREA
ncbi:MAG: hypothetical protein LBK91_06175, partial [Synergistaceae bacterium]|nr:hypothetical protein [Synergistaceae bacterium]